MSYQEWATLMLGAVSVSLTVLSIFIAGFGLWGYLNIRKAALKNAEAASLKAVEKYFDGTGIPEKLKALVEERMAAHADHVFEDLNLTADVTFSGAVNTQFVAASSMNRAGDQEGGTL